MSTAPDAPPLPSPRRRWLIVTTVMAATLMQVLDATIANVALPHMQAALGATPESIAWVLTSYIIMAAIATPVTGWLEARVGRRRLFALAIGGFTVSSALCGLSTSLTMMVVARALQGLFGAFIGPLGQAAMLDSSPREKHAQAMTIWGMGIMIGPIMGPVLGGWLTDTYGWRWVFYINLPIGIAAMAGVWLLLADVAPRPRRFDLTGFALIALALAAMQLALDRGSQLDWFDSNEVIIEAGVAVAALWMFVVHSFTRPEPLLPPELFRDRNFVIATTYIMLLTGVMMSGGALVAPMLQRLLGYDAVGAGMLMVPRGVGAMLSMAVAGRLSGRVDARLLIGFGMALVALSLWMQTGYDLQMGQWPLIWAGVVQGFAIGFAFLPLNLLAFSTLAPRLRTEGAAFYSLARNVGGSITISLTSALLVRNIQVSHSDLSATVNAARFGMLNRGILQGAGASGAAVAAMVDGEINRQALMIAYLDDFWVMGWAALLAVPLVVLLRRPSRGAAPPPVVME